MKSNTLYKIMFAMLAIFLMMPIIQTHFHIVRLEPLAGVNDDMKDVKVKPDLTWNSYKSNIYQKQIDQYLTENVGFREFFIPLYNQYVWSFYCKTFNDKVSVGNNRWLYSTTSVRDHYQSLIHDIDFSDERMRKTITDEALRLYKLQKICQEYGVALFVGMLPGKDYVFPEYLPKNKSFFKPEGVHAYDFFKEQFDKNGNNYIDINRLFMEWKDNVDFPLYYKTSYHWTNIATVHTADTLLKYMENLSGLNINNIAIGEPYSDEPRKPDRDLEELLNVQFKTRSVDYQYVDVSVIPDSTAVKPKLIVIGDSFFWNMTYVLPLNGLFAYNHYWYYNSTIYFDSEHNNTNQLDIVKELLDSDFIMLSYSTTQIYNLNRGFISKALLNLCYDEEEIQAVVEMIKQNMKNSQDWTASLEQKAKRQGRSLDAVMYDDAVYLINTNPEEFFDELRGTEVPTKRSRHLLEVLNSRK